MNIHEKINTIVREFPAIAVDDSDSIFNTAFHIPESGKIHRVSANDETVVSIYGKFVIFFKIPLTDKSTPILSENTAKKIKELIKKHNLFSACLKIDYAQMEMADVELLKNLKTLKCPECSGNGTVEYWYKSYSKDFECPVCNGNGSTTISTKLAQIYNHTKYLSYQKISLIRNMMKMLGVQTINVSYDDNGMFEFAFDTDAYILTNDTYNEEITKENIIKIMPNGK